MTRQIARGQKSEPQKLDTIHDLQPETRHLTPNIPLLQHSNKLFMVIFSAEPNGSHLT